SPSANSCMVYYTRATNTLNVLNDAGTTWMAGVVGTGGMLQNSQCSIPLGTVTALASGNTLTLSLPMTFAARFSGLKNIFMYAANAGGINSGWQALGTWTVPAG